MSFQSHTRQNIPAKGIYMFNASKQICRIIVMGWQNVLISEYDIRDLVYPIICTHHILHGGTLSAELLVRILQPWGDDNWYLNITSFQDLVSSLLVWQNNNIVDIDQLCFVNMILNLCCKVLRRIVFANMQYKLYQQPTEVVCYTLQSITCMVMATTLNTQHQTRTCYSVQRLHNKRN